MIGADTYSEKSEITHPNHMFDSLGENPRQRFTNTAATAFTWCHVERLNMFFSSGQQLVKRIHCLVLSFVRGLSAD